MDWKKFEGQKGIFIASMTMIGLFLLSELLSFTVFKGTDDIKYLLRIFARGILGLLSAYHGFIMLFTSKIYYLTKGNTKRQRRFSGILLFLLGLGMISTAFMGYGMNGNDQYIWWK